MSGTLYIAAKAPRGGYAKTRLGRSVGQERAVALYRAFLKDLAARFSGSPFELGWYVTPPDAWPEISALTGECGRVLFQGEGDWAGRQWDLFQGAADRGEERVVLVGSDSPQLTVEVVAQAFRELDDHDLVFGPTYDGGYYLIGMREPHDVLHGVTMSTGTEFEKVIARAGAFGLSVGRVETTFDVDEAEDLKHLRELVKIRTDLAATRGALAALGLCEDGGRVMAGPNELPHAAGSPPGSNGGEDA